MQTVTDFIFLAPKSLQMEKLKDACSLEENYDKRRQCFKKQRQGRLPAPGGRALGAVAEAALGGDAAALLLR